MNNDYKFIETARFFYLNDVLLNNPLPVECMFTVQDTIHGEGFKISLILRWLELLCKTVHHTG